MESVYSFFSYDVATYIAGNLEIDEGGGEEEGEGERQGDLEEKKKEDGGGGSAEKTEGVEDGREEEEDDEETDDAMSGLEYDTSTEEDAFEESKSSEASVHPATSHQPVPDTDKSDSLRLGSSPSNNHRVSSNSSSGSSHKPDTSPPQPSTDSSGAHSGSTNKTISSFTVENILMGNTSRSNSTSSGSPTSASHLANNTFLAFPPTTQATSGSLANSTPASPASANWTSHPPVKYTKFTMMSPSSMRIGGDKRRKGERDKAVTTTNTTSSDGNHHKLKLEEAAHHVTKCKEEPKSPAPPSVSVHLSTATPSSHVPHLTYHHSVIQTPMPSSSSSIVTLSRQNSSQSVSGAAVAAVASPRLVPVSPNQFSRIQTQSPHHPQQQQYVVFFPPNVALMTAPNGELQVIGQNSPQLYIQGTAAAATLHQANGNHMHKKTSSPHLSSSSPSPPPNSISNSSAAVLSSSNNLRLFRTSSNPSFTSSHKLTEPSHFHSRTTTTTTVDKSQATMVHKLGSKTLLPAGGEKRECGGKGMPKQKKLRFHMTTVVKKVRRRSSSVSLTAPPPTLCNRPSQQDSTKYQGGGAPPETSQHNNRVESGQHTSTMSVTTEHTDAESSLQNNDAMSSKDKAVPRPPHSSTSQTDLSSSHTPNSLGSSKQTMHPTKFENHVPPHSQSSSAPSVESFTGHSPSETANTRGRGRGRGRRSRGYTRRKRELTFHLYEDPYRAKRSRQQT